jgi:hypothetical protein
LCGRSTTWLNISVETMSLCTHLHKDYSMKYISEQMIRILERLAEMFPGSNYQTRLDAYLSTKGITDAAQLENYIRQFNSQKESYL